MYRGCATQLELLMIVRRGSSRPRVDIARRMEIVHAHLPEVSGGDLGLVNDGALWHCELAQSTRAYLTSGFGHRGEGPFVALSMLVRQLLSLRAASAT